MQKEHTSVKLRKARQLEGHALHARDGLIGRVKDFYFDDLGWDVRYCVVETEGRPKNRTVLISPVAIGPYDPEARVFPVDLTIDRVRESPAVGTNQPISRQHEEALRRYYGWSTYWGPEFNARGMAASVLQPAPAASAVESGLIVDVPDAELHGDRHLRSTNDTMGYGIAAIDGPIGHVEDFLIDTDEWRIRYLVIDPEKGWLENKVVIAPARITEVNWTKSQFAVDLTRKAIEGGPSSESVIG